jgi:hypothetical protein
VEDVVDVGRDDQPLDRQAHARGHITGKHVAEIARRHREGDALARRAQPDGGVEIIDDLRHQPRPVDRIDRRQGVAVGKGAVVEHGLHQRLGVVEIALDRDVVDVGGEHRRHLAALDLGHAACRVQHEDVDIGAPRDRIDRGRSGVAAGRADDGQAGVGAAQEPLEQQAQHLERDVLERQRGAVEQLQQPLVMVELDQGRDGRVRETTIGGVAQALEFLCGQAVADERRHDPCGGLRIGQARQPLDVLRRQGRPGFGHIEPAIAGETGQGRTPEIEDGGGATGTMIAHDALRLNGVRCVPQPFDCAGRPPKHR